MMNYWCKNYVKLLKKLAIMEKMHVDLDEFHKQHSEFEPNATLEVLKKEVQKGIIEIDNKIIRPTPLGIERCKLDKSLYS